MENNKFDIPHDQLARNKQLQEHQNKARCQRLIEQGVFVQNMPEDLVFSRVPKLVANTLKAEF